MSQHPNKAVVDELPEVSLEEMQAELQAVLRSSTFERSEKLQRFLRFICELTMQGEGGRINEYLIGSEVFLRGPDYSPSEDSVVRRQAHTLRQKLQEFYTGEGSTHPLRIELPVGRYVPSFRRIRESVPVPAPEVVVPPERDTVEPKQLSWRRFTWVGAVLVGLALPIAGYVVGTRSGSGEIGKATREIWGPWVQPGRQAVICFSSPLTAVIKHFDQELPPDTQPKRFRSSAEEEELFRQTFGLRPGGAFYFTPVVNQTKVGEAVAGVYLTNVLTRMQIPVKTTQSRFVSWEDLRGQDMILLGNNEANQWLDPLLKDSPFRLTSSEGKRQRAIVNTSPRAGEASDYTINYAANGKEGDQEFALVSMLPGLTPDQRLLLISGLNAQATEAAAAYLADEASLGALLIELRKEKPAHSGPWYFQLVLKTEVHDKVPTKTWVMAVRAL